MSDDASVVIADGATWTARGGVEIAGSRTAESDVVITGSQSRLTTEGQIWIGLLGNGAFNIREGGNVLAGGTIQIGREGQGSLTISDGGSVVSGKEGFASSVGTLPGSIGEVVVMGSESTWQNHGQIHIGREGSGTLRVGSGGHVIGTSIGFVGVGEGSNGRVEVSGIDARWSHETNQIVVGNFGNGNVLISRGAIVRSSGLSSPTGTAGIVGGRAMGTGEVLIQGHGSRWENVDGTLVVGFFGFGTGNLTITDGGEASSVGGFIGRDPDAVGHVSVIGDGSEWVSSDELRVGLGPDDGPGGTGTLAVSDHGRVVAPSIQIGPDGVLEGNGVLVGDVVNGGLVRPGTSPGILTIEGDYRQSPVGTLDVEIGGPVGGADYDQLVVTGEVALAGTVNIRFVDGFVPAPSDRFEVISSGGPFDVSGAAVHVWNLRNSYTYETTLSDGLFSLRVSSDLLHGDFNGNDLVEQADLDLILGNWGADGTNPPENWINDLPNIVIDQEELDRVLANWGNSSAAGAGAVPEPETFGLLVALVLAAVLGRRLRRSSGWRHAANS